MVLVTHAIIGVVAASIFPGKPILGFLAGLATHFLSDAIPHWDYKLHALEKDPENPLRANIDLRRQNMISDGIKIFFDCLLFLILWFWIFEPLDWSMRWALSLGALGGVLPDGLQIVYFTWPHQPMITIHKFHNWIHSKKTLRYDPLIGVPMQAVIVGLVILLYYSLQ